MRKQLEDSRQLIIIDEHIKAKSVFDLLDVRETTRVDYKARIKLFFEFTQQHGLSRDSFLNFKRYLSERNDLSVASKNKYLVAARIFLKELSRQGILSDITQNIKSFTQGRKHKKEGINDEEMGRLIEKIKQLPDTPKNTRLRAILSLLIMQGLRQVEIARLDVKDLDLVVGVAFIRGKGRDDKELIYLHPITVENLKKYSAANRIADGALFVSNSNNGRNKRITTRAIRGIVKSVLADLDINKSVHGFRHHFTTKLIKEYKGDLLEVARYTRHKSLEMLQVYNDGIKQKADLPRFYKTFESLSLN